LPPSDHADFEYSIPGLSRRAGAQVCLGLDGAPNDRSGDLGVEWASKAPAGRGMLGMNFAYLVLTVVAPQIFAVEHDQIERAYGPRPRRPSADQVEHRKSVLVVTIASALIRQEGCRQIF